MWLLAYSNIFTDSEGENGRVPIPPFSFSVTGARALNIRISSASAEPSWWKAGWLNQFIIDSELPSFEAMVLWRRIPIGDSAILLQPAALSRIKIEPVYWLKDLSIVVYSSTEGLDSGLPEIIIDGGIT